MVETLSSISGSFSFAGRRRIFGVMGEMAADEELDGEFVEGEEEEGTEEEGSRDKGGGEQGGDIDFRIVVSPDLTSTLKGGCNERFGP